MYQKKITTKIKLKYLLEKNQAFFKINNNTEKNIN